STAGAVLPAVEIAAAHGACVVTGTTGLNTDALEKIVKISTQKGIGVVYAANYALGAVLMMHAAKIFAKHLDSAEIIELHHDNKIDAPSGTALSTAKEMLKARGKSFEVDAGAESNFTSRGQNMDGISIHSVRLPGFVAHQEVIFGGLGQTLTVRHDTISRESFMPGVVLAVREVLKRPGLTVGLEALLGL
ncbi:4-hydroxy-tetrahydrodipicolinate reductase, partial [Chloroflexota bacterium]